jgi:hypothetical protein
MKEIKLTLSEKDACTMLTAVSALLTDKDAPVSACAQASSVALDIIAGLLESENPMVQLIAAMTQNGIEKYLDKHKEILRGGNPFGKG